MEASDLNGVSLDPQDLSVDQLAGFTRFTRFIIDIKNQKLEEIKKLIKEIHELDEKLDTKNIDPENDSRSALINIIENEYGILLYVEE